MSKQYHLKHPTISFRCRNVDEYTKIKQMVERSGKSESMFIREILLDAEKKESESFNSGYNQGLDKFQLPCFICGEPMTFDLENNPEVYQKIYELLQEYAHKECIEKQKKQQEAEQQLMFNNIYMR